MGEMPTFDVKEFDQIVADAIDRGSPTCKQSETLLLAFRQDPGSLSYVECILMNSQSIQSQLLAVQIIEEAINKRWFELPENVQVNLAVFITKHTQTQKARCIYRKLNECLVLILKLEYPRKYSTFIADIVSMSAKSANICANSFDLLSLFNMEMRRNLPVFRKREIVENFRSNFFHVYGLVSSVLHGCDDDEVLKRCLNALEGFLVFFSIRHLLECDLVELVCRMLHTAFSTQALSVLSAVVEKCNDVFSDAQNVCENCHLRETERPENEFVDILDDEDPPAIVDKKLSHLAKNSAYRSTLFSIISISENTSPKNSHPNQNQQDLFDSSYKSPNNVNSAFHDLAIGQNINSVKSNMTDVSYHKSEINVLKLDKDLPAVYFIQKHAYNTARCVECAYISVMRSRFLLSPSLTYTMLTEQDAIDLPLFREKLMFMHSECIKFLRMYFDKFKLDGNKFYELYPSLPSDEKVFVKEFIGLLVAFYETNMFIADLDNVCKGLRILLKVTKTGDEAISRHTIEFFGRFTSNLVLSHLYDQQKHQIGKNESQSNCQRSITHHSNENLGYDNSGSFTKFNDLSNLSENNLRAFQGVINTPMQSQNKSQVSCIAANNYDQNIMTNNQTLFDRNFSGSPTKTSPDDFVKGNFYYPKNVREDLEPVIRALTEVLIDQMPRPEDVIVEMNEFGDVERSVITQTDQLEFICLCQDLLRNCAILTGNYAEISLTKRISSLAKQTGRWSYKALDTACWSAGALAHTLCPDGFFTTALRHLLQMCEENSLRDEKALIAANILFLVAAFDSYLRSNARFHKTVVRKLFEFMAETVPGVPEMACDVFLRVVRVAPMRAVTEDSQPFLHYVVHSLASPVRNKLPLNLRRTLYRALFHASAEADPKTALAVLDFAHSDLYEILEQEKVWNSLRKYTRVSVNMANFRDMQNHDGFGAHGQLSDSNPCSSYLNQSMPQVISNANISQSCVSPSNILDHLVYNTGILKLAIAEPTVPRALGHVLTVYAAFFKIIPQQHTRQASIILDFHKALSMIDQTTASVLRGSVLSSLSALVSSVIPTNEFADSLLANVLSTATPTVPAYYDLTKALIERCARVETLRIRYNIEAISHGENYDSQRLPYQHQISNIFKPKDSQQTVASPFFLPYSLNSTDRLNAQSQYRSVDEISQKHFDPTLIKHGFKGNSQYYLNRESFIIQKIISSSIENFCKESLSLFKSLLTNSTVFFSLLFANQIFSSVLEQLLITSNEILIADACYEIVLLLINNALQTKTYVFFTNHYTQIFEAVLAGILEKETSGSLDIQSAVIKQLIGALEHIPQFNNENNHLHIKNFIINLFKTHSKHIQNQETTLFVEGLFALSKNHLILRDHVIDFRFKVDNMFLRSNIQAEEVILNERISICNQLACIQEL